MIPARSASATQSAPPRPSRAIANGRWARSARRAPAPSNTPSTRNAGAATSRVRDMGAVKAKKATEGRKGGRGICFTHARAKRFDPGAPARSARLRGRAQARGARVPRRAGAALRARAPRAAGAPPRAPARDRRRPVAGLPARDAPYQRPRLDGRAEITGPVERKMMINALNSGANVFMADFEDANAPTWENNVRGQQNLRDAVAGTIAFTSPEGKRYALEAKTATLVVRPRGWHLVEKHLVVDGQPIAASLFDFGLTFFHNAAALVASGSGPYFYLPKLESHLEARLWNDVFVFAQDAIGIPRGTIRAAVLIETILAAFETDEILWELRDHSAGLNCGRWDYIFSYIKKLRRRPECVLPDRARVTMEQPFLRAYADLVVHTCHRRGIHALGGMAAQIPIKRDAALNAQALEKVRQDKLREVRQGHDGTWVAHPGLVPIAREVFDAHMSGPHQIGRRGRTCASPRATCSRPLPGTSPRTACTRISVSRCSTSRGGSAAWAACPSTT